MCSKRPVESGAQAQGFHARRPHHVVQPLVVLIPKVEDPKSNRQLHLEEGHSSSGDRCRSVHVVWGVESESHSAPQQPRLWRHHKWYMKLGEGDRVVCHLYKRFVSFPVQVHNPVQQAQHLPCQSMWKVHLSEQSSCPALHLFGCRKNRAGCEHTAVLSRPTRVPLLHVKRHLPGVSDSARPRWVSSIPAVSPRTSERPDPELRPGSGAWSRRTKTAMHRRTGLPVPPAKPVPTGGRVSEPGGRVESIKKTPGGNFLDTAPAAGYHGSMMIHEQICAQQQSGGLSGWSICLQSGQAL